MDPSPSLDKKEDQQIIIRSAAADIIRRSEELRCVSLHYRLAGKLSNFLIYHIFPYMEKYTCDTYQVHVCSANPEPSDSLASQTAS